MNMRERHREAREPLPAEAPPPDAAPDDGAREAGDAFLLAADAAIQRALSGRAEAFLAQNRQQNGQ